jgi:hypothetical protein
MASTSSRDDILTKKVPYREEGVLNVLTADSIIVQDDVVAQLKVATTVDAAKTSARGVAARLLSDEDYEVAKASINEATTKDEVAEVIEALSSDLFSVGIVSSDSEDEGEEKTDDQVSEDSLYS